MLDRHRPRAVRRAAPSRRPRRPGRERVRADHAGALRRSRVACGGKSVTTGSDLLELSPVMPVVVIDDADDAVPTARALLAGGIGVIELTLRTPAALAAIERVATEVPEIVVGAGTVTSPGQAKQAADAGARFLVTPGCTDAVVDACFDSGVPFLPGAATVSEAMRL